MSTQIDLINMVGSMFGKISQQIDGLLRADVEAIAEREYILSFIAKLPQILNGVKSLPVEELNNNWGTELEY